MGRDKSRDRKEKILKPGKREKRAMMNQTIGPDTWQGDLTPQDSLETILTTDMGILSDRNGMNRQLERLKRENDELVAENHLIGRQLYLAKHNASLRVVTILTEVLKWLDIQGSSSYGQWNAIPVSPRNDPLFTSPGVTHVASPVDQPVEQRGPGVQLRDLMSPNPVRRTGAGNSLSKEEREAFLMPFPEPYDNYYEKNERVKETISRSNTPVSEPGAYRGYRNERSASPASVAWTVPLNDDDILRPRKKPTLPSPDERRSKSKSPARRGKPSAKQSRSRDNYPKPWRQEPMPRKSQSKSRREESRSYKDERKSPRSYREDQPLRDEWKTPREESRSHRKERLRKEERRVPKEGYREEIRPIEEGHITPREGYLEEIKVIDEGCRTPREGSSYNEETKPAEEQRVPNEGYREQIRPIQEGSIAPREGYLEEIKPIDEGCRTPKEGSLYKEEINVKPVVEAHRSPSERSWSQREERYKKEQKPIEGLRVRPVSRSRKDERSAKEDRISLGDHLGPYAEDTLFKEMHKMPSRESLRMQTSHMEDRPGEQTGSYTEDTLFKETHKSHSKQSLREQRSRKEERRSSTGEVRSYKEETRSVDGRKSPLGEARSYKEGKSQREECRTPTGDLRSYKEEKSQREECRTPVRESRSHKDERTQHEEHRSPKRETVTPRGQSRKLKEEYKSPRAHSRNADGTLTSWGVNPSFHPARSKEQSSKERSPPPYRAVRSKTPPPHRSSSQKSRSKTPPRQFRSIEKTRREPDYPPNSLYFENAPFMDDTNQGKSRSTRENFLTTRRDQDDYDDVERFMEEDPGTGRSTREDFLTTRKEDFNDEMPRFIEEVEPAKSATRESFTKTKKHQEIHDDGTNVTYKENYTEKGIDKEVDADAMSSREFSINRTEYRTGLSGAQSNVVPMDALPENLYGESPKPVITTPGSTIRETPPLARQLLTSPDEISPDFNYTSPECFGYSLPEDRNESTGRYGSQGFGPPVDTTGNSSFLNTTPDIESPPFAHENSNTVFNKGLHNNKKIPTTKRLIGEVAFQLDRRILNYVFASGLHQNNQDHRRFYGYIIQNIPEKINRESLVRYTGEIDYQKRAALNYRYQYILKALRPLGYDVSLHSEMSIDLVNKYGLLPLPSSRSPGEGIGPDAKDVIRDIILEVAPKEDQEDILILLECLAMMAKEDGKPMLMFS